LFHYSSANLSIVDTDDGYDPALDEIVATIERFAEE
jgi:hypothetical protein